jgi:hypothetical protein
MVDPDFELTNVERSELVMTFNSRGWRVVDKIILAVVEQFRVDLDNADQANPKEVMGKHALSKAASIVATKLLTRVQSEAVLLNELRKSAGPQEATPGLEMDAIDEAVANLPNLLGDVDYISEDLEEGR